LYIVHADSDQLTTVDLIDRTIRTVEIRPHLSWLEGLISFTAKTAQAKVLNGTTKQAVLSPDGKTLYVTGFTGLPSVDANGNWLWETIPLGLQKIDVASGEEMDRVNNETQEISLSGDGATLYLHGWIADGVNWTEIVNAGDLELIQRIERQFLQPAQTQDGKRLVLSSTDGSWAHRFKVIDAVLLKDIAAIEGKGYQISLP
jgi:DNA-binding beta-propeller fold protein YncE